MNNAFVKVGSALQDKLTVANKQNEISRQRLMRELTKLEVAKKSDVRMLETSRQRFRLRYRKFEAGTISSVPDAIDVRMYETHNPGFCYHCTGTIKASGLSAGVKETTENDYKVVRSMLFTNGEVDPDKVLCLHLLTAHSVRSNSEFYTVESVTSLLKKRKRKKHFSGAWNNVLPCYILDTRQDPNCIDESSESMQFHKDPCLPATKHETICNVELNHRQQNSKNDANIDATVLSTDDEPAKMISTDLKAYRDFTTKQFTKNWLKRSSMDLDLLQNEKELSFPNDCTLKATASRVSILKNPSKQSDQFSNYKFDYSITMLKPKNGNRTAKELVTIEPVNYRKIASKMPSTSTFRNTLDDRSPMSSDLLATKMAAASPAFAMYNETCRRRVYLNWPIKCRELRDRGGYRIVFILVNRRIQALVKFVLQILARASPEKMRRIVETARDSREIRKMLVRPDIQQFVKSLSGWPLILSFENFVVFTATFVDEVEPRFERALGRELMALTMEMPSVSSLNLLVTGIRDSIFLDLKQLARLGKNEKTSEIENSTDECPWEREDREEDDITELSCDFNDPCYSC